ncbi:MAG: response regulator [Leptospiraceae bacterium]|nr:response regulator [Leptospiraceae bacterium]MBK9502604.1 response regulator [Leptospiraceae bacterium]MBL0265300.1 response regulator [Leptospiraceae bacterium]MBP9163474.1 response regulator [Leptospiraceae bacterium]
MEKMHILIVDDVEFNATLLQGILNEEYKPRIAINGQEALTQAQSLPLPDLILLDVMLPDMDGYEICRKLKANPLTARVPVIFVSAMSSANDERVGFEAGAVDYIHKPISAVVTLARIRTHIALAQQKKFCEEKVELKTHELEKSQNAAIHMLAEAGHYNDTDTGLHIWRMAAYSRAIASAADWPVERAEMLELVAPLHDTGKIGTPDSVLKAPRKLTDEEWVIMKQHSEVGHSILAKSDTPLFLMAAEIALYHHEKWDGSGYPHGLSGNEIPESARIVAISDVFDALTTKRPYKEPWSTEQAFELIRNESGKHFDPRFVELFFSVKEQVLEIMAEFNQPDFSLKTKKK